MTSVDRGPRLTAGGTSHDDGLRCWHCGHKRDAHKAKRCHAAGCACQRYLATKLVPLAKRVRPAGGRALGARRTTPRTATEGQAGR